MILPASLAESYQQILSDSDSRTWALYSVVGADSTLKLVECGTGSLSELEFDAGKIQFAFAKVKEPGSGLYKYVLISWCGEGVPVNRKGLFSTYVRDVSNFFKGMSDDDDDNIGFHVHINARSEADVEESAIMRKVRDSSGAKYSIHKETSTSGPASAPRPANFSTPPVASAPKPYVGNPPLKPAAPMKNYKSSFAAQNTASSYAVQTASNNSPLAAATSQPISGPSQRELYDREMKEREDREYAMSGLRIREEREHREADERARERSAYDLQQTQTAAASGHRVELAPRDQGEKEREVLKAHERETRHTEDIERSSRGLNVREERERREAEECAREIEMIRLRDEQDDDESRRARALVSNRPKTPGISPTTASTTTSSAVAISPGLKRPSLGNTVVPVFNRPITQTSIIPAAFNQPIPSIQSINAGGRTSTTSRSQPSHNTIAAPPITRPTPAAPVASKASKGLCAKALYDYTADENNEISIRENEVISQIEKIDEGWWKGVNEGGQVGLFPADYVEIVADEQLQGASDSRKAEELRVDAERRQFDLDRQAQVQRQLDIEWQEQAQRQFDLDRKEQAQRQFDLDWKEQAQRQFDLDRKEQAQRQFDLDRKEQAQRQLDKERHEESQRQHKQQQAAPSAYPTPSKNAVIRATAIYEYIAQESNEISLMENELITDIIKIDEGWWTGTNSKGANGLFPANYVEVCETSTTTNATPLHPESPSLQPQPAGFRVTAMYDYEATEANEISIVEGDVLSGVEVVSDDWWQGVNPRGLFGLFPASYVERS